MQIGKQRALVVDMGGDCSRALRREGERGEEGGLLSEYFHRVREIVAESRSGDEIVLLNLQRVPLGRRPS